MVRADATTAAAVLRPRARPVVESPGNTVNAEDALRLVDAALLRAAERAAVVVLVADAEAARPQPNPFRAQLTVSSSNSRVPAPESPEVAPEAVVLASAAIVKSPRPMARPADLVAEVVAQKPQAAVPDPEAVEIEEIVEVAAIAPRMTSPRPQKRPADLAAKPEKPGKGGFSLFKAAAVKTPPNKAAVMPKKGSVCGNPAIRGETMAPITAKVKGCGIDAPVKVTSVAGVKLSQAALMDCTTAKALHSWVENGLQPQFGKNPVVQLQVAGHYVCRSRNHKKGARISEHGKGRAIDISGFTLANGQSLSILKGWRSDYGKAIKAAHRAACGTFGTTLGPGSDGMHEDHLHFDTARHRNGAYCK
jgi:hypothetical protein